MKQYWWGSEVKGLRRTDHETRRGDNKYVQNCDEEGIWKVAA